MTKEARFRLFVYQARALAAEYRAAIINWTSLNEGRVLDYKSYFWRVPYEQAVKKRNDLEAAIKISRMNNDGGVDFTTLDEIWHWGFSEEQNFPMRDQDRILRVTPEALAYLDSGDCFNACKTLMPITYHYPHPSGATKILGLSDQENYCIYDSRVGRALDSLRKDGKKIVLCPPLKTWFKDPF